ncbi:hypothetical protein [Paenibacillus phocaensis]|uniref:hypothetical protein n=1 Tax=Paenibacillus phocaensis TaxID=1776378 RepID=UPI00039EA86F|nr:hypothetical protein [Paenibacillus phocaensis]
MKRYPRIIYYDKAIGSVLYDSGEPHIFGLDNYEEIRIGLDYTNIKTLSERNRETIGELHLELGQYKQDFIACSGYRVNPDTQELEFTYTEPGQSGEEPQELVYQPPLSEQVSELKQAIAELTMLITKS